MKKLTILAIVISMLCGAFALGEETMEVFNGQELLADEMLQIDLNGDGAMETISWQVFCDDENYTEEVALDVLSGESLVGSFNEYLYMAHVYVADVDSDGVYEIFVTGDIMSNDYVTYCMHYTDQGLERLMFADANRGVNTGEYYDHGWGYLTNISDSALTLYGTQDVLGTYFGARAFGLQDGVFELVDDGIWRFDRGDLSDPELWEYGALTVQTEVPVIFVDDGEEYEGMLATGEQLLVVASDKVSIVYFVMQDGRQGYFYIETDADNFGSMINGLPEDEVFGMIPYAD